MTLSARALNPGLFIVARANQEGSEAKLAAGRRGPRRLARTRGPGARSPSSRSGRASPTSSTSRCRTASSRSRSRRSRSRAGGPLDGQTVGTLRRTGIFALAVVRGERDYEPNPADDRVLAAGENLIVSGTAEILRELRARA